MGKKHFCFFQTAETGNRTPNSGVKGSGANHYPRAPAGSVDESHGWEVEDTHIEPVWSEGPILPSRLVDILSGGQDNSDDDDTLYDEPDFDVAFSSNVNDDDYNNWKHFHT